jgi:hypothetical protein
MKEQIGTYRRPSQSNYAKPSFWAGHAAELIGAVAGFALGFILLLLFGYLAPNSDLGWVPWITMLVGALGTRAVVLRQFRR